MVVRYLIILIFFIFHSGFSQTEIRINGKVVCEDYSIQGIEVVNLVSEKTTITDGNGNFSILAKADDMLVFVSKNYEYKRLFLDSELMDKNNFVVSLSKKPEELEEVIIFTVPNIKLSKDKAYEQRKVDELALEKAAQHPKPYGVYDGVLVNSPDLLRIGGMILSLFIKEKEKTKEVPKIKFKTLVNSSLNQDFFQKTLLLKPEETGLFLEFCDADPKSKAVLENANALSLMDFLFEKNVEFKKLPVSVN